MPFHAVVHREQMHCPQTGFNATSSEEEGGGGRTGEVTGVQAARGVQAGVNLSCLR